MRKALPKHFFFLVVWQKIEPQVFGAYQNQQERKNALDTMIYSGVLSAENDSIFWIDSDSPHLAVGSY